MRHGRRGRGGRGGRRVFDATELRRVLLHLIAAEPRHGYDLIRAIEDMSGSAYAPSPGVVYPALSMLDDQGFIQAVDADGARKMFEITDTGRAELESDTKLTETLLGRLEQLASNASRLDAAPVKRAMRNLKTALRDRLDRDDADKDTVHDIAAILDDAAQRIERL